MSDERKAWEQRADETQKAYAAFQIYLTLSPYGEGEQRRNLANVADQLGLQSTSGVESWSSKYDWVQRTLAYDAYMGRSAITLRETDLAQYQIATLQSLSVQIIAMNEILEMAIARTRHTLESNQDVDPIDLKRMMEAIKIKDDLARRIGKMPTDFFSEKASDVDDSDATYLIGGS